MPLVPPNVSWSTFPDTTDFQILLHLTGIQYLLANYGKSYSGFLEQNVSPSAAYHHETDGKTEIMNRKLEEMIRSFLKYDYDNIDE